MSLQEAHSGTMIKIYEEVWKLIFPTLPNDSSYFYIAADFLHRSAKFSVIRNLIP
jgi:hypothetical protein